MDAKDPAEYELVFCRYITRKGKKIYPKNAAYFRFWVKKKPGVRNGAGNSRVP